MKDIITHDRYDSKMAQIDAMSNPYLYLILPYKCRHICHIRHFIRENGANHPSQSVILLSSAVIKRAKQASQSANRQKG